MCLPFLHGSLECCDTQLTHAPYCVDVARTRTHTRVPRWTERPMCFFYRKFNCAIILFIKIMMDIRLCLRGVTNQAKLVTHDTSRSCRRQAKHKFMANYTHVLWSYSYVWRSFECVCVFFIRFWESFATCQHMGKFGPQTHSQTSHLIRYQFWFYCKYLFHVSDRATVVWA